MGDVLNWRMPIEWDDGTACELMPAQRDMVTGDVVQNVYLVRGQHEPRGWNRSTMPKLGMTKPIMVNPDGTLDCARGPGMPFVVNTKMPLLRFLDGSEPVSGRIEADGTRLILTDAGGTHYRYAWPTLRPMPGNPKLIEITPAMVAAEEKAAEEVAAMQDNPYFGMF